MKEESLLKSFVLENFKTKKTAENSTTRDVAKRLLNSASGKFGQSSIGSIYSKEIDDNDIVVNTLLETNSIESVYVPIVSY
jgi:hypothetical protein